VEVRALEVGHDLKTLLPYRVLLILNREKRDMQCAISSTPVSGSLLIMDPDHSSVGSKGIVMLTSH
jgi:hypothetical protein